MTHSLSSNNHRVCFWSTGIVPTDWDNGLLLIYKR